ncbi:MAG: hypothetical protein MR971_07795 [Bacteroidales bacterium]|nr:hypothetical protein [Bacteroidales bacterium]
MDDFIPITPSPRRETLAFLRAFARFYSPHHHNEAEARRSALWAACLTETPREEWWPRTGNA